MNKLISSALLCSLLLSGCALLEPASSDNVATSGRAVSAAVQRQSAAQAAATADPAGEETSAETSAELPPLEPIIFPGTDNMVNLPQDRRPIQLDGGSVILNFEEAPLLDVVHSILGDTLGLDYVVDGMIGGQVTLRTRSPVPRDQLLPILESLLQSNGVAMVRDPNDRYFVSASPSLGTLLPAFNGPGSEGAGYSNVIVPLNYISASAMADILRPVAPESAFVRVDGRRNLLVLAGTSNQIGGWMDIVSTFDVDQLSGMSVGVFPLDNASVADVEAALGELLGTQGGGGASDVAGGEGDAGAAASSVGPIRVMPLEELNSILVVSPRAHYIEQVRTWIERLDEVQAGTGEAALYVYPVQNGNASQLAELLSMIFGGSGSTNSSTGNQDSGVAPGLSQMNSGSGGASMPDTGSNRNGNSNSNFEIGDNVRVVADTVNNSLLIYAPRKEYNKIVDALQRLDITPAQVLIEASIIEVTLTDDLQYGLEWRFNGDLGSDYNGSGMLNLGDSGDIGPRVPGFSYSITNNAGEMRAVLNALAERSLVNVLSTPSILVLDNHTAAIHVGDQQPIQSATVISNNNNVATQSIEYKDTGVQLEVTPTVNAGDLVTMDILQSVTDVGPVDSGATNQRSFLERNISSRVAIRSGESVVLGGLIRDNSSRGRIGLPWLQDIPILGHLFGRTVNSDTRTELLVFITPRVLRTEQDLRDISREMRTRMQGLEHFEDLPIEIGGEGNGGNGESAE